MHGTHFTRGKRNQTQIPRKIIAARGDQLTDRITKEANSDIGAYGIEIIRAEIKALDLPDDNKAAVCQFTHD